jgi:hypothetical protein
LSERQRGAIQSQKDILVKSISNFKEYDKMKGEFERRKNEVMERKMK